MICKRWFWILNCPNPCHQLNLMMKDLMIGSKKFLKIAAFTQVGYLHLLSADMLWLLKGDDHCLSHHHLLFTQQLCDTPSEGRAQERKRSVWHPGCWGNTLLIILNSSSQYLSLSSPDSTLPGFRDYQIWYSCSELSSFLHREHIAECKQTKFIHKYLEAGPDCLKFQLDLHNVNQLLTPITHGLETFERQNTTCSDVFHVYIGITVNFVTIFSDRGESCSTFIIMRPLS
jgi:hypothetical protein